MPSATVGLRAKKPITGNNSTTHNFDHDMYGYVLMNDGASDLTVTISGDSYTVKPGETFDEYFESFRQVTITNIGGVDFRAYGRG